jgi:hypothetical protein
MRRLKFYLFILWFLALFAYAAQRYPVPMKGGLELLKSLATLALLLGAWLALGRSLLKRFKIYWSSLTEEACFSLGLGSLAFSSFFFILGSFSAAYAWLVWLALGACWLICWDEVEHFSVELRHALRSKHPWEGSSTEVLTLLAASASLACALALCMVPVTFYDALVYHLALPLRAAATASSLPQPGNLYSWLPGGAQPLWTACLLLSGGLGSDAVPHLAALLNFSFGIATTLAVLDAAARFSPKGRLWLAPALFLTQPLAVFSYGVFCADGIAAFLSFLSLYAFLNTLSQRNQNLRGSWLRLGALLAGFAVAVKPVALVPGSALFLLLILRAIQDPEERRPGLLLSCLGLFLLPLLPWACRNFFLIGNPVYPFGLELLGLKSASSIYMDHLGSYGSGLPLWRLPWDATFESAKFGGDGHLSFLFLALLPAAFFIRYFKEQRWLAAYLGLNILLWALGPRVLRYALPAVPGLCLFAAYALGEIEEWAASKTWSMGLRLGIIASLFLGAGQSIVIGTMNFHPWAAALGLEAPQDYLLSCGVNTSRAAAWLQAKAAQGLQPKGLILLGDSRSAGLPAQTLASTVFEAHPFKAWIEASSSPEDLDARLAQKGYDFVLVNQKEWNRIGLGPGPHYDYFSPDKEALFMQWLEAHRSQKSQVFEGDGVLLFPLNTSPEARVS